MTSVAALRDSWLGTSWLGRRAGDLLARVRQFELLDRAYTLAAGTFVALIPLILVITALLAGPAGESVVAEELIERFGLIGAAAQTMRELIDVRQEGIYWLGALITAYSAFVLGRRTSRAYNAIWRTPRLPAPQEWRSLLWVVIQVVLVAAVTQLRAVSRDSGTLAAALLAVVIVLLWGAAEYLCQRLFTRGLVERRRLLVAAAFVSIGRIGFAVWTSAYLSTSLARQALAYGPIGVVFSLFSGLLALWLVLLGATLLAAVLTEADPGPDAEAGSAT